MFFFFNMNTRECREVVILNANMLVLFCRFDVLS